LGNLLFDIQPDRAIDSWRKAVQLDNSLAIAHRNLGWAYYRHLHDIPKAIEAYEKAVAADPSEARVFEELDKLYEMGNISVQKRLALLEKNHAVVASLGHSFSREINVNVLVGNYDKAIGFLDSNYFNLREGGTGVHSLHVDAHLLRGLKALASKNLDDANKDFLRAAEYPDNHCLGAPRRDRRMPQIAFYTGLAFEASGDAKKAAEYFQRSVKEKIDTTWFDAAYYQALSQSKLGATDKAQKAYDLLIQQGSALLAKEHTVDFFAKFGEQQTEQAQKAWAHYVKALGYLGKGEKQKAQEDLEKSAALDVSNVWVQYELGRQL
jgi:tetratricopeptide (TPR) repeat protein